jgi:hypothetical protein
MPPRQLQRDWHRQHSAAPPTGFDPKIVTAAMAGVIVDWIYAGMIDWFSVNIRVNRVTFNKENTAKEGTHESS